MQLENERNKKISRREMLKLTAVAGAGAAIGASGFGALTAMSETISNSSSNNKNKVRNEIVPFHGLYQAGIVTPQQTNAYIATFNFINENKLEVIQLLKDWTKLSELVTVGKVMEQKGANDFLPPNDTGESEDLTASNLSITYGFGTTFFNKEGKDRFGIANKMPKYLKHIPKINGDALDPQFTGGDICIQVCADDQQVAFHAIRNLIRVATGKAELHYLQAGFINAPKGKTPRNLFGFKDGTANISSTDEKSQNSIVWAEDDEPKWMQNGSYMAIRKIQMMLEIWDRTSLKSQEDTFGRKKLSGAAYGNTQEHDQVDVKQLPQNSHTRMAKETGQQIYRRAYSYTDGIDMTTGNMNSGLLFICYQSNPDKQLVPMLKKLAQGDLLNEYIKHIGSGLFACPGGIKKGEYIGQKLFEA